jgi:hypothetical protein
VPGRRFEADIISSNRQRGLLIAAWLFQADCVAVLMTMLKARQISEPNDWLQVTERPWTDPMTEQVVPRTVVVAARWADWRPAQASITVPTASSRITLRRDHAGTFDDALVRRARAGASFGPDGLRRLAEVYLRMARETGEPAHAREATTFFERFLATSPPDDRRAEAERALAELAELAK